MPTSHLHQINEILELIVLTNPQTILDVGVGFGKYGALAREYLELRDGRNQYNDWQRRIDGIEVFSDYITPLHDYIYDTVRIGDATEIISTLNLRYDLILLIDVLEHFTKEEGVVFLDACMQKGRNVLISTPKIFFQQRGFNNPYEQHLSHWKKKDLSVFGSHCFIPNLHSTICYLGEDSNIVHENLFNPRSRFKRTFPFLRLPHCIAKRRFKIGGQ